MDATNFLTASPSSIEAFKTANLLKGLPVSAVIFGERGTGKLTLARYILPHAPVIDGSKFDELIEAIQTHPEIIIYRIDHVSNVKRLLEIIIQSDVRVIATGGFRYSQDLLDEVFSIKMILPPLTERKEDVALLIENFVQEASKRLGKDINFNANEIVPDLTENSISLRRQVYLHFLLDTISETDLMGMIEHYLEPKLGTNNDYRSFLHLYEVPLIRAGMKRFKSQLQLADKLGLNRNTLRKKIAENSDYELELKEL